MIPGKKYKPEDFAEIAWRRRWFVVGPLVVIALATFVVTQFLPNRYRSEAVVMIIPARVPEALVKPTITQSVQERLAALQQRILSRTQLERIVQDFNLYEDERKTMLMEQVVERMKKDDVQVQVGKAKGRKSDPNHFTISFDSGNPRTAQRVTERLAALFVNANLEERELQSSSTSQFLLAQLDETRKRLFEQEKKLEQYKRAHYGELPSQVQSNVHIMQSTIARLQQLSESAGKDRDRRLMLQQTIAQEEATVVQYGNAGKEATNASAVQQLEAARASLRGLELKLKSEHPDVIHARRTIRDLERKVEAEALQQPVSGAPARVLSAPEAARQGRLTEMRAELQSLDRRIAAQEDEEKRLQQMIAAYRGRIEVAPARETELTQLTRDYESLQVSYGALLKKSEDSNMAANIERRQAGEQFRIVDTARTPEKPFSPDRLRLNLLGILAGLGCGLALAGLLEYRDTSLRTEDDVLAALSMPVVAPVPTMWTAVERRRARTRRLVFASTAAAMFVVSAAALAWKLRLFETWSR